MNIKWMNKITNEEVLGRSGEKDLVEESEEEKRSDDGAHTETRGIAKGYLGRGGGKEKEKRETQIKIFRPNNWGYGMRDI